MNTRRSLKAIEANLAKALNANHRSEIECGEWLVEAKKHLVEHGEWLPWLEAHFPHSVDTAARWMGVAKLLGKFRNLRNLRISKSTLYRIASEIDEIDRGTISAIVKVAAKNPGKWTGDRDILPILYREREARKLKQEAIERGIPIADLKREREQQIQARVDAVQREQREQAEAYAEADALLDATLAAPCDAPPLPVEAPVGVRPSQGDFVHDTLTNAVEQLDTIVSKPMHVVVAAPISSDSLERAGRFLLDIVNARNANQREAA
jgi:Protein of unknown function (DUF3102)